MYFPFTVLNDKIKNKMEISALHEKSSNFLLFIRNPKNANGFPSERHVVVVPAQFTAWS